MRRINRINRELEGYMAPRQQLSMNIEVDAHETTVEYYAGDKQITEGQFNRLSGFKGKPTYNFTVEYID